MTAMRVKETNEEQRHLEAQEENEGVKCTGCSIFFPSRNLVFRHLRETNGACLDADGYKNFVQFVRNKDSIKVMLLYGYLPSKIFLSRNPTSDMNGENPSGIIRNGEDAARLLLDIVYAKESLEPAKDVINRSYGCISRSVEAAAQDNFTGALSEVVVARLPPMNDTLFEEWTDQINAELKERLSDDAQLRILGRYDMKQKKFNAEMDVTRRRVEYILPADFLLPSSATTSLQKRQEFFDTLNSFNTDSNPFGSDSQSGEMPKKEAMTYLKILKKTMQLLATQVEKLDESDEAAVLEKDFHNQKRKRQRQNRRQKEKNQERQTATTPVKKIDTETGTAKESQGIDEAANTKDEPSKEKQSTSKKGKRNVLRRRRYHNFTPRLMAHEFIAYRRLDRVYHRATIRFPETGNNRPFVSITLSGDLFLNGQARQVVGLFLALLRGVIDPDIVDCVFDEHYPQLVPTPAVPSFGMFAGEATYIAWEGKAKAILSPRRSDRYEGGWGRDGTLKKVADWQQVIYERLVSAWLREGYCEETGALTCERLWTKEVLEPWAERAREQLIDYRKWKAAQETVAINKNDARIWDENEGDASTQLAATALLPPPEAADPTTPHLYTKVLDCLRKADASGLWPTTTPKRQLVMVSTQTTQSKNGSIADTINSDNQDEDKKTLVKRPQSLAMARLIARSNTEERASAYAFAEGEGGASGSFSVGAMPGEQCTQPKGNSLFPELMKAAFELEIAICPNREPSSTIAINRNAQFRPHTDSGAGAGQSTSLIVGIGTYIGGELMVEGEKKDIRYQGVEFNGWTQRHWTMPFRGERYSLVWFTPKGCEGVHGIDLCQQE